VKRQHPLMEDALATSTQMMFANCSFTQERRTLNMLESSTVIFKRMRNNWHAPNPYRSFLTRPGRFYWMVWTERLIAITPP
jgi:hypothetical protein